VKQIVRNMGERAVFGEEIVDFQHGAALELQRNGPCTAHLVGVAVNGLEIALEALKQGCPLPGVSDKMVGAKFTEHGLRAILLAPQRGSLTHTLFDPLVQLRTMPALEKSDRAFNRTRRHAGRSLKSGHHADCSQEQQ